MEGSFNFLVKSFFAHNANQTDSIWVGYVKYKQRHKSD